MDIEHNTTEIQGYHAHVYYDNALERDKAAWIKEHLTHHFPNLQLGTMHAEATGPHPLPMFQIRFTQDDFSQVVSWLVMNHQGLSVLIHPDSGEHDWDYDQHSMWLGKQLKIRMEMVVRNVV